MRVRVSLTCVCAALLVSRFLYGEGMVRVRVSLTCVCVALWGFLYGEGIICVRVSLTCVCAALCDLVSGRETDYSTNPTVLTLSSALHP